MTINGRRLTLGLAFLGLLTGNSVTARAMCVLSSGEPWCNSTAQVIAITRDGLIADITKDAARGLAKAFLDNHTVIVPAGWNVTITKFGLYQAKPGSDSSHDSILREPDRKRPGDHSK